MTTTSGTTENSPSKFGSPLAKSGSAAAESRINLKFRIFAGCSGWGPQQLDGEMERGDWLVSPANMNLVFAPDPYDVWDKLIGEASASPGPIATPHVPPSPEWN